VSLDVIGPKPIERRIEATAEERAALARRFDLLALDRLEAVATLRRIAGRDAIRVELRLVADVVQRCVVTLGEVPSRIEDAGVVVLAPESAPTREVVLDAALDAEAEEEVEPLTGNEIDLGEMAAQNLAVALDPWPRVPGATLGDVWTAGPEEDRHPLAALAAVRKKRS